MKKAKQALRENSGQQVNTQRENSPTDNPPDVQECRTAIKHAVEEIDDQFAQADDDISKMKLLGIRQSLSGLYDYWKSSPVDTGTKPGPILTPPATPLPTIAADPFPVHEDPQGVAGPRLHIRDCYEAALKNEHDGGFLSLINLWRAIEHHPGLRAEKEALKMLTDGSNALCELSNRHYRATECYGDFTGGEVWLANLLNTFDKTVTTENYILKLSNAPERLRGNPKTAALAEVIQGMFDGRQTLWKMNLWLSSL